MAWNVTEDKTVKFVNNGRTEDYKKKQTTIKPVRNADTNHTKCIRNNPAFQLAGFATILIIILTIATTDTMKTYKEQKEKEVQNAINLQEEEYQKLAKINEKYNKTEE